MKTIYNTNIIVYSSVAVAGLLSGTSSHGTDKVHRRPVLLRNEGDPSAGQDAIIRDGFMPLSEVVNKYLADNTSLTAERNVKTLYITDN